METEPESDGKNSEFGEITVAIRQVVAISKANVFLKRFIERTPPSYFSVRIA